MQKEIALRSCKNWIMLNQHFWDFEKKDFRTGSFFPHPLNETNSEAICCNRSNNTKKKCNILQSKSRMNRN